MDLVQGLFVDILSAPPKSLDLAYLYSAVTNRSLNMLRNHRNRARLLAEQSTALRGPERTSIGSSLLSLNLIMRLVESLDARSAEIVVYHYLDDLNQDEVAVQMGMSRRAVVKRLSKIREAARRLSRAASQDEPFEHEQSEPEERRP